MRARFGLAWIRHARVQRAGRFDPRFAAMKRCVGSFVQFRFDRAREYVDEHEAGVVMRR